MDKFIMPLMNDLLISLHNGAIPNLTNKEICEICQEQIEAINIISKLNLSVMGGKIHLYD